jgi:hypothetical protein
MNMELLIIATCLVLQTIGVFAYFGLVVPKALDLLLSIDESVGKLASAVMTPEEAARRMQMPAPVVPLKASSVVEPEDFEAQMEDVTRKFQRDVGLI